MPIVEGNFEISEALSQLSNQEIESISALRYEYFGVQNKILKIEFKGKAELKPTADLTIDNATHFLIVLFPDSYKVQNYFELFLLLPKSISKIEQLSNKALKIELIPAKNQNDLLFEFSHKTNIDCFIIKKSAITKRLFIFDMDSTLIEQECIDELARQANVYHKIASITEKAMNGELDFNESLRERVKLLQNQPIEIIDNLKSIIKFKPGVVQLCKILNRLGIKMAVVSGGFVPLAEYVKCTLGLHYCFANNLEVSIDGRTLTGNVLGDIVNGERKAELLATIAQCEGIPIDQVCAVGDGANDLLMLKRASMGIAYNAKPKVQMQAEYRLNQPSLLNVLYLMGFNAEGIKELSS